MTCTSDTRSRSPSPRTKMYEMESIVAITISVAFGGQQSANSYPGGHEVSTVQDVAVMHDTGTQSAMTLIIIFIKQPVCFDSVLRSVK